MTSSPSPRGIRTAAIAALALAAVSCTPGVLDPVGPVGEGQRTILLNSLVIMLAIVIPTIVLTLAFAWWFRAGNEKATHLPGWSYSGKLELLVWSIPLLVVIFLGGIGWIGSHQLDPYRPLKSSQKPLTVQVIALDWKWLFIYPEQGVASVNRLVIPVGTPVNFRLTSGTVMNSFFVPQLGGQIYTMAGMETKLALQADRPGSYRGLSAHYSGEGFADMHFPADAVSPGQFAGWVAAAKQGGRTLDGRTYLAFAKQQATSPAFTFAAVAPGLFDAAVKQSGVPYHEQAHAGEEY